MDQSKELSLKQESNSKENLDSINVLSEKVESLNSDLQMLKEQIQEVSGKFSAFLPEKTAKNKEKTSVSNS